jgi:hypothetical protein
MGLWLGFLGEFSGYCGRCFFGLLFAFINCHWRAYVMVDRRFKNLFLGALVACIAFCGSALAADCQFSHELAVASVKVDSCHAGGVLAVDVIPAIFARASTHEGNDIAQVVAARAASHDAAVLVDAKTLDANETRRFSAKVLTIARMQTLNA